MHATQLQLFFAQWPIEWLLIGLVVALIAIDALRSGISRAASVSLAAPLALVMYQMLGESAFLGSFMKSTTAPVAALVFACLFVALFFLISRMTMVGFSSGAFPVSAVLAGLAATIVLLCVWMQAPPLVQMWSFGPLIHSVFASAYDFWWLLGAYAVLAFASL